MNTKHINLTRVICMGGILVALTTILQAAPIVLPMLGLALSPLSTFPIAIATMSHRYFGMLVYLSSTIVLAFISIQEASILLFTTGLLGFVLGSLLYRIKKPYSLFISSISLTMGIMALTYVLGVPGFVAVSDSISMYVAMIVFFAFSFMYALIWMICLSKLKKYGLYKKIQSSLSL